MVGFNYAPVGYAFCNGAILPISQNTALFSLLGTTFGGNGTVTFGLPDLRSRVPVGQGQGNGLSNYVLGQAAGTENVTLLTNQMPVHTHIATGTVTPGASTGGRGSTVSTDPTSNYPATAPAGSSIYGTPQNVNMGSTPVTVTVQPAGGSLPVPVLQPYLAVNFIIATVGIFPSRP